MRLARLLLLLVPMAAAQNPPLKTVDHVDLNRYLGKWYEIARYPNRFESVCASDATAEYTMDAPGKIQVRNSCRKADGTERVSKGTAKVVDAATNAKLKVTFFWPFYGDYWIVDLAPDYSYAVVGEPSRKYLWILSRTPDLPAAVYEKVTARLRDAGYDPARLVKTPQRNGRAS
jgi:apolipoprotein D and lipocalin family protein